MIEENKDIEKPETDKPVEEKPEIDKPEIDNPDTEKPVEEKSETDIPETDKSETDKSETDKQVTDKTKTGNSAPDEKETKNSEGESGEEIVVDIEHLKKSFGKSEILKDINLKIKRGETIVTLGKSGTGKSVTLKCIVGLIAPDSGKVKVLGKNIPDLSYEALQYMRKKSGFVFQSGAL